MTARFDINQPVEGFYKTRLVKNGPWVGVHIWFAAPVDPETGEPLDRSPRWYCLRNKEWADPLAVWPTCCDRSIDHAEYLYRINDAEWCRLWAPDEPAANPHKSVDLNDIAPLF